MKIPNILITSFLILCISLTGCSQYSPIQFSSCLTFEDLANNTVYKTNPASTIVSSGHSMPVTPFNIQVGGVKVDSGNAGGIGNELFLRGATLTLDVSPGVDHLRFHFHDLSQNIVLTINGVAQAFSNLSQSDQTTLGGVIINIGVFDNAQAIEFGGQIFQFSIGAEELYIDNVCQGDFLKSSCIDFESLPLQIFPGPDFLIDQLLFTNPMDSLLTPIPIEIAHTGDNTPNSPEFWIPQSTQSNGSRMKVDFPAPIISASVTLDRGTAVSDIFAFNFSNTVITSNTLPPGIDFGTVSLSSIWIPINHLEFEFSEVRIYQLCWIPFEQ